MRNLFAFVVLCLFIHLFDLDDFGSNGLGLYMNMTDNPSFLDESVRHEIEYSIKKGLEWLGTQQQRNGSFENYPAITGLVLSAFIRSPFHFTLLNPRIDTGYKFILNNFQPDGSICLKDDQLKNYNTAICLMALKDASSDDFISSIQQAENYLLESQFSENNGFTEDSLSYGGLGYGEKTRSDLSNFQWGIEALQMKKTDVERRMSDKEKAQLHKKEQFYQRALVFLARCQNLKSANPESYSLDDGGFMYEPGKSKAGGTRSYGTMTYAGLKSMLHARLNKDDPRVLAAFNWIRNNYNLEAVPAMDSGTDGLYYYYHTMAKALNAYRQENITDANGIIHTWRNELALNLIRKQKPEGFWVNDNPRWREDNRILVTAYVVLALEEILNSNLTADLIHSPTIGR